MAHFLFHSEENYLKALFKLQQQDGRKITNSAVARALGLNPATVLEMLRKMEARAMVELLADKSIRLTEQGRARAVLTIRKHRIWEVFLVEKLQYEWNEVHELAEQLEHVESEDLINRLEAYLGHPSFDPHGDPIPDKLGQLSVPATTPITTGRTGVCYVVRHFVETSDAFLAYLQQVQIKPGTRFRIAGINEYDQSFSLLIGERPVQVSQKVAANILVAEESVD